MKKFLFISVTAALCLMGTQNVAAQGFLKKAQKAVKQTAEVVSDVTSDNSSSLAIDWSNIPIYTAQEVVIVDTDGNPVLNEDGTQMVRVFLVDQNGNKRSAETVKAQQTALGKAAGKLIAKVGIGAGMGALQGGGTGAIAGAATGALASAGDIKMIKEQKKSLDAQKKLIKAYQQNFTDEGVPVDASADLSKIKDLNLDKSTNSSMTVDEIAAITSDPAYKDSSVEGMSLDEIDL